MKFPCPENNCTICCHDTEMPLLESDIARIKVIGYFPGDFLEENDGWLQLRNKDGRCYFHDGNRCTIYDSRPEGCRSYPLLYDEEYGVVMDDECPHWKEVEYGQRDRSEVILIVGRLLAERKKRLS